MDIEHRAKASVYSIAIDRAMGKVDARGNASQRYALAKGKNDFATHGATREMAAAKTTSRLE